jgi:predicted 3-demethylubiquinone-9 3-methyltransferase (glyoxalase superfamily)
MAVFGQSKIISENQFLVLIESSGQKIMCMNGGPQFTPNPSISFFVTCETEKEVNNGWKKLSEGGQSHTTR